MLPGLGQNFQVGNGVDRLMASTWWHHRGAGLIETPETSAKSAPKKAGEPSGLCEIAKKVTKSWTSPKRERAVAGLTKSGGVSQKLAEKAKAAQIECSNVGSLLSRLFLYPQNSFGKQIKTNT